MGCRAPVGWRRPPGHGPIQRGDGPGLVRGHSWYGARTTEVKALFLGVLGHDMRTPVEAMTSPSELLLQDKTLSVSSAEPASLVFSSSRRVTRTIDDLLDFARVRLGTNLPLARSRGDIRQVVRQTVDELMVVNPTAHIDEKRAGPADLNGFRSSLRRPTKPMQASPASISA